MSEAKSYFSPSQIKSAARCLRKWNGESCQGWRQPDTPSTTLGKRVHEVVERYLEGEYLPNPAIPEDAIALPALRHLPDPGTPFLVTEQEVFIPAEEFDSGKDFKGYLDASVLYSTDARGDDWLLVFDLKTTSDLKYAKSEEELRHDPQFAIYAWAARQLSLGAVGRVPVNTRFTHAYARTRGAPASMKSYVEADEADLRAEMTRIAKFCREEMLPWDGLPFDQVPPNPAACGDYGGCHLRPECAQTGLLVYGDSPEARVASKLLTTRMEKDMSLLKSPALAASALSSLLRKPTPAAAAAAPASLNPPDGDVHGVSGMAEDPKAPPPETDEEACPPPPEETEATEETEVPEAPAAAVPVATPVTAAPVTIPINPAAENPADTQAASPLELVSGRPSPDEGYVADKPQPFGQGGVGKGRPSEKPELWDRAEQLVQQLQADPSAWARALLLDHTTTSKLLRGTVKMRNNAIKLEELREIVKNLDSCAQGTPAHPVVDKIAEPQIPSDDPVLDAEKYRDVCARAVVDAKQALVVAQKRSRELDDIRNDTLKDEDEEAYTRYQAEVYGPARRRVQATEQQLQSADAALATAQQEQEQRLEDERKAKELAAAAETKQEVVHQVEVRVTDAAQLAALATSPKELAIGDRKQGCILIKGSVPTRKHKNIWVHIDEIVNAGRLATESAAMTSYYGAIKDDSASRICAEVLRSLKAGTLQLPAILVAPAKSSYLQDRVIDALSPYLLDYFAPLS